jgi:hypothetical protein
VAKQEPENANLSSATSPSNDLSLPEESTDYSESEPIELLGDGENLDRNRFDQPRTTLERLPEALRDRERGNKRPEGVPDRDRDAVTKSPATDHKRAA